MSDSPDQVEKYGVPGGVGLLLVLAALVVWSPILKLEDIRTLGARDLVIAIAGLVGCGLVTYALSTAKAGSRSPLKEEGEEMADGGHFPETISGAINDQLLGLGFYKRAVVFRLTVEDVVGDDIVICTELSYHVHNRTDVQTEWRLEYKFKNASGSLLNAEFNGDHFIDSKDTRSARGISIRCPVAAGTSAKAAIKVREQVRGTDSDVFTSYHPATDMTLILVNKFDKLKVDFESLYFKVMTPEVHGHETTIRFPDGILPYQGVRLNWNLTS